MQRREFISKAGKAVIFTGIVYSFHGLPAKAMSLGKKIILEDITVNNPPLPFSMLPSIENLEYPLDVTYTGTKDMLYATISGNDPTKLGVEALVEKLANDHYKIHLNFDSYDQLATQNITVSISDTLSGVYDNNPKLEGYDLSDNYPDPFNPSTNIDFKIPSREKVEIDIYDITGRHISTVLNEEMSTGKHTVQIDADKHNLKASQVYIYTMKAGPYVKADKMVLAK